VVSRAIEWKLLIMFARVVRAFASRPIFLDLQSTTPVDPRVLDSMLPYLTHSYGNPHSRTHAYGWDAEAAVEEARGHIAELIHADPKEIVFTSGATESNNTALKGVAKFYRAKGKDKLVTVQTEHKCVLDTCRHLQSEGFSVTYLPVQKNGLVDLEQLRAAIDERTSLVSVMAVNNEIGVVQPIKEIGALCREKKVFFHTDAAQALGKLPIDVEDMKIDLMSITAHKIYGPKGIGALYVRRKPRVRLVPLMNGGGQERGLRSGTLAPHLCVGFGAACRIAKREMERDREHVTRLASKMLTAITEEVPNIVINGDPDKRLPGSLNISFAYVEGESLIMSLKTIAVSSGSACTSASLEPSYVLRALGVEEELAHTSIRFGMGRFTTEEEIDYSIDLIKSSVARLREMSPLWEMVQEGMDLKTIQWSQPH
jgi:cysteine desulfurase